MSRDETRQQLITALNELARCCKGPETSWPWPELFKSIEDSVVHLVATERKRPPSPLWKAFELLSKRNPSLRLTLRVNNVVKHARDIFEGIGESPLDKLARQDGDDAQKLLGDLERLRTSLSAVKGKNWAGHERVLAQLSRTRTVELASDLPAPIEVRCYTRALELLLLEEFRHKPLKRKAAPLLLWLLRIGHPQARDLLAFDPALTQIIEREYAARREQEILRRREDARYRTQRHRYLDSGKLIYPGDWLKFKNAGDFALFYGRKHPLPKVCAGLEDSPCRARLAAVLDRLSCGRALADEPYWYYHRTRHVARCPGCQEAEWCEQGFEVENGFPYGQWNAPPADRIAARDQRNRQKAEQSLQWAQSPQGQQWLREANRRFDQLIRQKEAR